MAKKTTPTVKNDAPATQGDDVINNKLAEINALISPYKLAWVSPDNDCELLVKNARYMTKEQLERLTNNVKNDGFLSQIPFCIREENGKYRVLSGNHRVKSAIKAGLPKILVMYGNESDFDEQKQLAIQLSHNAISGQDDLAILKDLYLSLKDLQLKAYSGINETELMAYKTFDFSSISEQDIALNEINFMFSDVSLENVDRVLDALDKKGLDPESDVFVQGNVDEFIEVMTRVKKRLNIKNRSVALRECDIIVYSAAEYGPLFLSGDIVVINPEAVRCVIQVKGTLNRENMREAVKNLESINKLRPGIWKLIVGFNTSLIYDELVKICADSKTVNGIFTLASTNKNETEDISSQMQKFVGLLKMIAAPTMYQTKDAGDYVALKTSGEGKIEGVPFPD